MTSSLSSWYHKLKIFYFENLAKKSFNKQKTLLFSHTKQFLDRGQICPLFPVQIGCENSPVDRGLTEVADSSSNIFSSFSIPASAQ